MKYQIANCKLQISNCKYVNQIVNSKGQAYAGAFYGNISNLKDPYHILKRISTCEISNCKYVLSNCKYVFQL